MEEGTIPGSCVMCGYHPATGYMGVQALWRFLNSLNFSALIPLQSSFDHGDIPHAWGMLAFTLQPQEIDHSSFLRPATHVIPHSTSRGRHWTPTRANPTLEGTIFPRLPAPDKELLLPHPWLPPPLKIGMADGEQALVHISWQKCLPSSHPPATGCPSVGSSWVGHKGPAGVLVMFSFLA